MSARIRPTAVGVTLIAEGMTRVHAHYTIILENPAFSGVVGVGEVDVVDEDVERLVGELLARIEKTINEKSGLAIAETETEQDREL
jgi:hypothetical protein